VDTRTDNASCGACGTTCAAGQVCSGGVCGTTCAAPLATCGPTAAAFCANTANDPANCGACATVCALAGVAANGCASGACTVVRCNAGAGDCDGAAGNGCETNTQTSVTSCGSCGRACALPHASARCAGGSCAVAACAAGFADCDLDPVNGCEVNTGTDNTSCGACGTTCAAGQVCSGGACGATCASPLRTCGTGSTAFCANAAIDPANCGACGTVCALANVAAQGCGAGACTVARCTGGFGDCDGAAPNGCETDLSTSAASCGACGRACALPNATATCAGGACAVMACATGFRDCNNDPTDGCEVDTRTDNTSCGACGTTCAAGRVCSGGACGTTCALPLRTCGMGSTAFCANTAIDPANCNACGTACALANVATNGCTAGACTVVGCSAGFGECNATAADGCETNLTTSTAHCGSCGRACTLPHVTTQTCTAGACVVAAGSCATGYADCNGLAADGCEAALATDGPHCGACGTSCGAGQVCSGGVCGASCGGGLATCGTAPTSFCANLSLDPANCNACGRVCSSANVPTPTCAAGVCNGACAAGFGDCDANRQSNGCETPLTTLINCGGCGAACPTRSNSTPSCATGACTFACATGFADCDRVAGNGCEVSLATSAGHCGACGVVCSSNHVAPVCAASTCAGACATGYADCNADKQSDGCETSTSFDPSNCGGCGLVCSGNNVPSPTCAASVCNGACATGFGDCDGNKLTNGCEVPLTTPTNCGACGVACTAPSNATAACTGAVCGFTCNPGYALTAGVCVAPPRPIAPLSTATVTSRRPQLRWALLYGDGAHVDLCRNRALTAGCVAFDAVGTSGAPASDLATGVWFWRLTARTGGVTTTTAGPVWQFVVGARTAPVNTSSGTTLDLNGDGFADTVVGAYGSSTAYVYFGGATLSAVPDLTLTRPGSFGWSAASAGDVNGDG
jgi:hypothetical protein